MPKPVAVWPLLAVTALLVALPAAAATKKALPNKGGAKHPEYAKACAATWPAYLAGLMRVAEEAEEPFTPAEIKRTQTGFTEYCLRAGPEDPNITGIINF